MPPAPALTETWAAAYIQVIVVILVFVVSIPPLIKRLELPEYLRRIRSRHIIYVRLFVFAAVFIYAAFAMTFVWVLHPSWNPVFENPMDWAGAVILSIALFSILLLWVVLVPRSNRRAKIINSRKDDYLELYLDKTKKKALVDLISIGEQSEPGFEKGQVIVALAEIIKRIQKVPNYDGGGEKGRDLDLVIRGIETILVGDSQHGGNYYNFRVACRILSDTLYRLRTIPSAPDVALIMGVLRRLVINALKLEAEDETVSIVTTILQNIADFAALPDADYPVATRAIFLVGFTVLAQEEEKRYLFAIIALNKLLALANGRRHSTINIDDGIFLLGLLAHFWVRDKSGRKFARRVLSEEVETLFEGGIRNVLKQAAEIHEEQSRFDTADALLKMAAGL